MKKLFITIVSLLFFAMYGVAQDCYSDNRSKGVSAYNSGKYAEAKKYFQSAQNCDMKPKQNDVTDWIGKCETKLNEQKQSQNQRTQATEQSAPKKSVPQVANISISVPGELNGIFSVSPTKKICFSQGNLQYQASTNTWRFAEYQYDIIGYANKNISSSYGGWIDLFGWGTSGYNKKDPYMISKVNVYYGNGVHDIAGTEFDWGVYNKISNGGNQTRLWRTLTNEEWEYVIKKRTDASSKIGIAKVNGVLGIILLPDSWILPTGLTFSSEMSKNISSATNKTTNIYTTTEWDRLNANGAVFLPTTGTRSGTDISNDYGGYWSGSARGEYAADFLYFYNNYIELNYLNRSDGRSVRLVRDVK